MQSNASTSPVGANQNYNINTMNRSTKWDVNGDVKLNYTNNSPDLLCVLPIWPVAVLIPWIRVKLCDFSRIHPSLMSSPSTIDSMISVNQVLQLWCLSVKGSKMYVEKGSKCPYKFSRSEEHTSELQSHVRISYAVFCLKKKKHNTTTTKTPTKT